MSDWDFHKNSEGHFLQCKRMDFFVGLYKGSRKTFLGLTIAGNVQCNHNKKAMCFYEFLGATLQPAHYFYRVLPESMESPLPWSQQGFFLTILNSYNFLRLVFSPWNFSYKYVAVVKWLRFWDFQRGGGVVGLLWLVTGGSWEGRGENFWLSREDKNRLGGNCFFFHKEIILSLVDHAIYIQYSSSLKKG